MSTTGNSDDQSAWLSGGCLCGALRYQVDPDGTFDAGYCHCSMCRRSTGAPVVAWALVRRPAFKLLSEAFRRYQSSDCCVRCFCPACGGQVFYEAPNLADMTGFHIATLDDAAPAILQPRLHMFAGAQYPWLCLRDHLPRFADNALPDPDKRGPT